MEAQVSAVGQVVIWSAPVLFGLCVWFIARFISKHDEFHTTVTEKFEQIAKSQAATEIKVAAAATTIAEESIKLRTANVQFQTSVNQHLLKLHQSTADLNSNLSRALKTAEEHEKRMLEIESEHEKISDTVTKVVEIAKNVFRVSEAKKGKRD